MVMKDRSLYTRMQIRKRILTPGRSERESRPMKCSPGQRSRASHAAGTPLPCGPMSNSWMNYPGLNKTVLAESDCFALKPFCLKRRSEERRVGKECGSRWGREV